MQTIYLDNAATTPFDPEVIQTITKSMEDAFGNPSSSHQIGRKAKGVVENARKNIAKMLGCTASEIVFTAGGSEADNLILRNAITNLQIKRIISSKIEHHAVLHTIQSLEEEFSLVVEMVDLNENGDVDYEHLKRLLQNSEEKTLVSLMLVNNEIGNILDTERVFALCRENDALFHSDTVQGIVHLKINLQEAPMDFIAASAHKFHGPKGVGFAYFKKGFGIQPILIGGEQERGARAGTENTHSILGMEKALSIGVNNFEEEKAYISDLKLYFIAKLKKAFPDIVFNGNSADIEKSAYHILNVRFSKEIPMLLFNLDLKGIAVSGGSACQSGSNKGSHVLNTILPLKEAVKTSVRFSFSKYNTVKELDDTVEVLKEIVK